MKEKYLDELKHALSEYEISEEELQDILLDYEQLMDDAILRGLDEEKMIELIGSPKEFADSLKDDFEVKQERKSKDHDSKWVALSPFIAVATYMVLGFGFHAWHPGWMIFLIIPIFGILFAKIDDILHTVIALSPFIAVISYFLIGFYTNVYHPTWVIFLIIPFLGSLASEDKKRGYGFALTLLVATVLYLLTRNSFSTEWIAALFFIVPITYGVATGMIHLEYHHEKKALPLVLVLLFSVIIYIGFGIVFQTWGYLWMIFLLIPMISIITYAPRQDQLVALMPFVSVIIFYSLGWFFGLWVYSWIAFLLIPVVAIIKNA